MSKNGQKKLNNIPKFTGKNQKRKLYYNTYTEMYI